MSNKRTLRALLIGIDRYEYITPLFGCKSDIRKIRKYLEDHFSAHFTIDFKTLFDKEATKEGIGHAFFSHLIDPAQPDDVVLIYFSGHGAQEEVHPAFKDVETDGLLEGLVCYDTGRKGAPLMADKELRYLLHKLSEKGPEIVMISDSCHSGDNTRSGQAKSTPSSALRKRGYATTETAAAELHPRLGTVMEARKWEEFLFADEISQADLATKGIDKALPEGRYVQIAACEDREFAYEHDTGGIFTHNLLKFLEDAHGRASYFELQSKVKFAIKDLPDGVMQTPRIYTSFGNEADVFRHFLLGDLKGQAVTANIVYNDKRDEWILDKGAIHGVEMKDDDSKESLVMVPIKDNRATYAEVMEVFPTFAVVAFEDKKRVSTSQSYTGFLKGILSSEVNFKVSGIQEGVDEFVRIWNDQADNIKFDNLKRVEDSQEAHYEVQAVKSEETGKRYFITTFPGETKPLVYQQLGLDESSVYRVLEQLQVFPRWRFLLGLQNTAPDALSQDDVILKAIQEGKELTPRANIVTVEPAQNVQNGRYISAIKIELENTSDLTLYAACLYMGANSDPRRPNQLGTNFNVIGGLIPEKVVRLEPGARITLNDRGDTPEINFTLNKYIIAHGWKYDTYRFKVIVSTEDFSINEYEQKGTKMPDAVWPELRQGKKKSIGFVDDLDEFSEPNWQATLYEIRLLNPEY